MVEELTSTSKLPFGEEWTDNTKIQGTLKNTRYIIWIVFSELRAGVAPTRTSACSVAVSFEAP